MRLALNLGYWGAQDGAVNDPADALALVHRAEQLGYAAVWVAEAYGSDAPTILSWLAAQTSRIHLGSAVMQIPARTPAMTAMTAATLDRLSGGRFRLGLGVSGPQVSEGWHGVRFAQPLERTREYVEIVRMALARRPVRYDGRHYRLPLPDGPGRTLRLTVRPLRERIPVYLAALGPRNLRLAGEIADGWLAVFFSPRHAEESLAYLREGRGGSLEGFDIVPTVPLVVGDDLARCADAVRGYAALYIGGMGSREQNFYHRLAVRMGYAEAADAIQDAFLARRYAEAAAAVPEEFIDAVSLLGPTERIAQRLAEFAAAGVTTLAVTPFASDLEAKLAALEAVAKAVARADLLDEA